MKNLQSIFIELFFLGLIALSISCKEKEVIEMDLWDESQIVALEAPEIDLSSLNFEDIPYKKLSEYGFFKGKLNALEPAGGVLIYEPSSSLFTDYAFKTRFIWMPVGSSAKILEDKEGTMEFPDHTIIIKNFYYPIDFSNPEGTKRILETRLLVKKDGIWDAYPYVWKDDQSDAEYKVVGAEKNVHWIDQKGDLQVINYIVPNKNQCKNCHNIHEVMAPIGVKAKHLNHDFDFGHETINQLVKWENSGYLSGINDPTAYPSMVNYNNPSVDLNLRALAYLDINCGHCHREQGPASTSGLFLTYEERDSLKLGVNKTPVAAGFGAGSFKYDIVPGKADHSILTYRMGTNLVGAAMPEIGRVTIHKEGLQLIKDWINSMNDKK
ncbi:SO2930 family diheme c-type cytochrome [Shivajiella indica]|uniref:SO2930 family diheme c-type cytochrome n=1 Tax=Shivajiella indica TaxID=872115 RepID=A0ABW5BCY6_9BACT